MSGVVGKSGRAEGNPGNKGGRPYSKENREKAATLKGLCLDWAREVMEGKDENLKRDVALKILPTCMPQEHRHSGSDESDKPIPIISLDKYALQGNNSDKEDSPDAEEDKDCSGGNICQ